MIKLEKQPSGYVSIKTLGRISGSSFIHPFPGSVHTGVKVCLTGGNNGYALAVMAYNKIDGIRGLVSRQGEMWNPCGGRKIYVRDQRVPLNWTGSGERTAFTLAISTGKTRFDRET